MSSGEQSNDEAKEMLDAYKYFFSLRKNQVLEDEPDADISKIFEDLNQEWQEMANDQRQVYVNLSKRTYTSSLVSGSSHLQTQRPLETTLTVPVNNTSTSKFPSEEIVHLDDSDNETESQASEDSTEPKDVTKPLRVRTEESETSSESIESSSKESKKPETKPETFFESKADEPKKEVGKESNVRNKDEELSRRDSEENKDHDKDQKSKSNKPSSSTESKKNEKRSEKKQPPKTVSPVSKPPVVLSGRICRRIECSKPAIKDFEMEDNFCSADCCIKYCRAAFVKFTDRLKQEARKREASDTAS
jgi:hypothetical protein